MARWAPLAVAVALLAGGCARPATSDAGATTTENSPASAPSTVVTSADLSTEIATPSELPPTTEPTTSDATSSSSAAPTVPGCHPATIPTRHAGTLTLATTADPSAPWFTGANPSDGQGYEAALATEVATRLGYGSDTVRWMTVSEQDGTSGTGGFDAYLGQVIIPDKPTDAVSYSTGYFDDISVVLAKEGSPASGIDSMSQLAALQVGSLGGPAVPDLKVSRTFTSGTAAASDLQSGAVDAVVAPLSVAADPKAVGGLQAFARVPDAPGWQARQLGMVSPAGSGVTDCLSKAIDMLRVDGTLTELAQRWLPASTLPVLADR
jgi:polar amino acid transport system substrate-binding protein